MSRLRPFAYSTGVGGPSEGTQFIQPSSSGTSQQAKQLRGLELDINPIPNNINFVAKEPIDGSVQVRTRFGSRKAMSVVQEALIT